MRISTYQFFTLNSTNSTRTSSNLNDQVAYLSAGKRVLTAKDDSISTGRLLGLKDELSAIEKYQKNIKKTLFKSCKNCHSNNVEYPWYYKLPIAKKLIDDDINEGKKHLILTNTFPFKSHGTPIDDLVAISKNIKEGTMPPFRYKIMHWNSWLSREEKDEILFWTKESEQSLKGSCP